MNNSMKCSKSPILHNQHNPMIMFKHLLILINLFEFLSFFNIKWIVPSSCCFRFRYSLSKFSNRSTPSGLQLTSSIEQLRTFVYHLATRCLVNLYLACKLLASSWSSVSSNCYLEYMIRIPFHYHFSPSTLPNHQLLAFLRCKNSFPCLATFSPKLPLMECFHSC